MKIVVDTNIIFSALLNSNGTLGDLLFNSDKHFDFYSCSYMRYEIQKHWQRLQKISKLTNEQLEISRQQIFLWLNFSDEAIIPEEIKSIEQMQINIEQNGFRKIFADKRFIWVALIVVILLLGFVTFRMMKDIK